MAKADQQLAKAFGTASSAPIPVQPNRPPAGFTNEGRPDIDGWLKPVEGLVVWGKIAGHFSFIQRERDGSSKVREVICVRVFQETPASLEGGKEIKLVKGQILAMSMMYCLEPLKVYIEHRGEVWIQYKTKTPLGRGQFVWKADVFGKGTKAAAPLPIHQAPSPAVSDTNGALVDDNDPFAESWSS